MKYSSSLQQAYEGLLRGIRCILGSGPVFWLSCVSSAAAQVARDLVGIGEYATTSGKVEVDVLAAATQYQQSVLDVATPWYSTSNPPDWIFCLTDIDGDRKPDLLGIGQYNTPSGRVELHVLSAASQYQQQILAVATP